MPTPCPMGNLLIGLWGEETASGGEETAIWNYARAAVHSKPRPQGHWATRAQSAGAPPEPKGLGGEKPSSSPSSPPSHLRGETKAEMHLGGSQCRGQVHWAGDLLIGLWGASPCPPLPNITVNPLPGTSPLAVRKLSRHSKGKKKHML